MRLRARVLLGATPILALAATTLVAWDSSSDRGIASRSNRTRLAGETASDAATGAAGRTVPASTVAGSPAALELTLTDGRSAEASTTSGRALDAGDTPHARERVHASRGPAAPMPPAARTGAAAGADLAHADLARIRSDLRSADARVRAEALRVARDLRSAALVPDITVLLEHESEPPVRRLATQVLAQGDPAPLADLFRSLKKDKDPIVQANAAFGLARSGDEREQEWLLCLCEATRRQAPGLLPVIATALEDPALRSPAVIARFQQVADNPKASRSARDRALSVLRAKQGS